MRASAVSCQMSHAASAGLMSNDSKIDRPYTLQPERHFTITFKCTNNESDHSLSPDTMKTP